MSPRRHAQFSHGPSEVLCSSIMLYPGTLVCLWNLEKKAVIRKWAASVCVAIRRTAPPSTPPKCPHLAAYAAQCTGSPLLFWLAQSLVSFGPVLFLILFSDETCQGD